MANKREHALQNTLTCKKNVHTLSQLKGVRSIMEFKPIICKKIIMIKQNKINDLYNRKREKINGTQSSFFGRINNVDE